MSLNVEIELKEILTKFDNRLESLQKDIADIRQKNLGEVKVELTAIKGEIKNIDTRLNTLEKTSTKQEEITTKLVQ